MYSLYQRIDESCKSKNSNISKMCRETSISRSVFSELNSGRTKSLSTNILNKVAKYLNVSTDFLLGMSDQNSVQVVNTNTTLGELSEVEMDIMGRVKALTLAKKMVLINLIDVLEDEDDN